MSGFTARFEKLRPLARGNGRLRQRDLAALGYRKVELGGLSWLATETGAIFIAREGDWSAESLAQKKKWSYWDKGSHALYLTDKTLDTGRFLIKLYYAPGPSGIFHRPANKTRNEFVNTLAAYRRGFSTILPAAYAEGHEGNWGVIVYPFLEDVIGLDEAYAWNEKPGRLSAEERRYLEKSVAALLRKCVDTGVFPVNMCLSHFLAKRQDDGSLAVYWIDFEKVKFSSLFRTKYNKRNLSKLLARVEWLRTSGGKVNRSSVLRVGRLCLLRNGTQKLDKDMCRSVIAAAKEYRQYRELDAQPYRLDSVAGVTHGAP